MRRVGAQIQRIARNLGFASSLRLARIRVKWNDRFRGSISMHAWPVTLNRGTLTIVVDSPAWLQQLSFLKDEIVAKLEDFGVNEIKLRSGHISKPQQHQRASDSPHKNEPVVRALTDEDRTFIAQEAASIVDDDLRSKIQSAISAWAARRPSPLK